MLTYGPRLLRMSHLTTSSTGDFKVQYGSIQPGVGGVLKGRNDVALICEPTYGVNRFFKCGSPEKKTNSRRRTYGLQVRIYGYGTAIRRSGD